MKQAQSDLRAIGVMASKPPPTTNHHQPHRGYFGKVHRDEAGRHDDLFLVNDDLTGHHGDVHIEWNEGWRPILTLKPPPTTNHQQPPSGIFGNVHRDEVRRHDELFLVDDDLTGHRGDVHIEWNEGWRPILTHSMNSESPIVRHWRFC